MKESFSQKCKEALTALPIKKKCCRYLWDAVMAEKQDQAQDAAGQIAAWGEGCRCEHCLSILIRALFVKYGAMTDPEKRYHLEFTFRRESERDAAAAILENAGVFKRTPAGQDAFRRFIAACNA